VSHTNFWNWRTSLFVPTRHDSRAPHTRCALADARPRARLDLAWDAVRVTDRAPRCVTGGGTKRQELQGKSPVHTPECVVQTSSRVTAMKNRTRKPRTTVCYAQMERVGVISTRWCVWRVALQPGFDMEWGLGRSVRLFEPNRLRCLPPPGALSRVLQPRCRLRTRRRYHLSEQHNQRSLAES